MNSQREAELKPCPMCGGKAETGYEEAHSLDSSYEYIGCTNCSARVLGDAKEWNTRQAATEQGVGEPNYSIEEDLEETQKALSVAEAKIEEYEGFFTGEDGDNHNGDAKAIINEYLNIHPPKPTWGGVPDDYFILSLDKIKEVCTSFFYWWYNQPGANTQQGFDEWINSDEVKTLLATQQPPEHETSFQSRVNPWLIECFGEQVARDQVERNHRFLEEALELVQATGCTEAEAHELVSYVYGRDIGDPPQEVGGVMVTLAALCLAQGMDMHDAGEAELARIWTKVSQIREKQKTKPAMSPLPGVYPGRQTPEQEQPE